MVNFSLILGVLGFFLLYWRLGRAHKFFALQNPLFGLSPFVSIIVPARNEEVVLPKLLDSLKKLDYPHYEIIVVDDCSTDQTAKIAQDAGVILIRGKACPAGWNGKQWACAQGSAVAKGEWLLFTDADTWHNRDSLMLALQYAQNYHLEVLTALPFHMGDLWWEKLLGPFHLMLMAVTAPNSQPSVNRKFAVGQYLLFSSKAYRKVGGHEAVRSCLAEDLALARLALNDKLSYGVYSQTSLYQVRMYSSLSDFINGWRRNFRAGFKESPWTSPFEITLMVEALTGGGQAWKSEVGLAISLLTIFFMIWRQKKFGQFSPVGPVFFVFSVVLFTWITFLSVKDLLLRKPQRWKGREFFCKGSG